MHRRLHDVVPAALLAVVAFALYRGTFQVRQFGDSSLLAAAFAREGGEAHWYHALYMPAAGLLERLLGGWSRPEVLRLLSSACGALAVSFAYLLTRAWRAPRPAALLGAGLLALTPATWFFSTQIEVHTLHAACVGLCALVTLRAPWGRPAAAALLVAAVLPLLFLSHQSGLLLGPGFVALTQHARVSRGLAPLRPRTLLLLVAPLYLAALLAAVPMAAWLGDVRVRDVLGSSPAAFRVWGRVGGASNLLEGWVLPLGLLLPLAATGAALGRLRGWALAAPLVLFLPSACFFVAFGLPERGGYTLGSSMFLVPLAAAAVARAGRRGIALGALALALQGYWGHAAVRGYDTPQWRREQTQRREGIACAIGARGGVISFNASFQYIEAWLPDVVEVNLMGELSKALARGATPADFVVDVRPRLEPLLERHDLPVALDRSHLDLFERVAPDCLAYSEALEDWLRRNHALESVEGCGWPIALVERARVLAGD